MEIGDGTRCVHGGHTADGRRGAAAPRPGALDDVPPRRRAARVLLRPPRQPHLDRAGGRRSARSTAASASRSPPAWPPIGAVLRLTARAGRRDRPAVGRLLRHARARPHRARSAAASRSARCPPPGPWPDRVLDGATLLLVETPSNPGLDVCDIRAPRPPPTPPARCWPSTTPPPPRSGQRPLALGADLTVASDTKALAGHGDVLLGHVSTADPALAQRLREARTRSGAVPGPMEAWLAHRGLGTLDLRLARQAANADALARAAARAPRRQRRPVARPARRPVARRGRRADAPVERRAAVHAALGRGRRAGSSPPPATPRRPPASAACAAPPTAGSAGATPSRPASSGSPPAARTPATSSTTS